MMIPGEPFARQDLKSFLRVVFHPTGMRDYTANDCKDLGLGPWSTKLNVYLAAAFDTVKIGEAIYVAGYFAYRALS